VTGTVEHLHHADPAVDAPLAPWVGGVHIVSSRHQKVFASLDDFRAAGLDALAHKLVVVS